MYKLLLSGSSFLDINLTAGDHYQQIRLLPTGSGSQTYVRDRFHSVILRIINRSENTNNTAVVHKYAKQWQECATANHISLRENHSERTNIGKFWLQIDAPCNGLAIWSDISRGGTPGALIWWLKYQINTWGTRWAFILLSYYFETRLAGRTRKSRHPGIYHWIRHPFPVYRAIQGRDWDLMCRNIKLSQKRSDHT